MNALIPSGYRDRSQPRSRCPMAFFALLSSLLVFSSTDVFAQDPLDIQILYIEQQIERPPVLSNLVTYPDDEGLQGAALGIEDNNTTGRFLGQTYALQQLIFEPEHDRNDVLLQIQQALQGSSNLVVLNVPAQTLIEIADMVEAQDDLLFNAQAPDNVLREVQCRHNVLHTMASRQMLSDALGQFFTYRKWRDVFLIEGNRPNDTAFASSIRQSLKKFGLTIVEDKTWLDDADMRRNAAREVPVFTQAKKYDALIVADEDRDFSQYILYNTWLPRPVAGSAGLTPVVWSPVIEQWGAAQLQSRFGKLANREMTSKDYANWAAVRSIGEAVTRINSTDTQEVRAYVMSDDFELAGFKGASLSYRQWNGQLRQPIQLVHDSAVVATAPIEGFLHPVTELDTLGRDKPESACSGF